MKNLFLAVLFALCVFGDARAQCNNVDFNNDGLFPDTADIDAFLGVVVRGETCVECDSADFNNDWISGDLQDVTDFLRIFSGDTCTLTGPAWYDWVASDDSLTFFVAANGSDSSPGTYERPFQTTFRAFQALRHGHKDGMFLRRGDVFIGPLHGATGSWNKSGKSTIEPMFVGAYGSADLPRPIVVGTDSYAAACHLQSGSGISNLVFDSLDFRAAEVGRSGKGLSAYAAGSGILVQNCSFDGFAVNVSLEAAAIGALRNITLRGCTSINSWNTSGHSQGFYSWGVDGLNIEYCFFDHNGWKEGVAPRTIYNHNMYIASTCNNVLVSNTQSWRASATLGQARAQRTGFEDCLGVDGPCGFHVGHADIDYLWHKFPEWGNRGGTKRCLLVGGGDISQTEPRGLPLGWGMCVEGCPVEDNIVIQPTGGDVYAASFGGLNESWKVKGNIVFGPAGRTIKDTRPNGSLPPLGPGPNQWRDGQQSPVTFEDFCASMGLPDREAYRVAALRSWNRSDWLERYEPLRAYDWIKDRLSVANP